LNRELGDRHGEAATQDSVGYVRHLLGDRHASTDAYRLARQLYQELGDRFMVAETHRHLGDALAADGDLAGACEEWRCAVFLLDELRHPRADKLREKLRAPVATGSQPADP
jgi:hypothetical protein